MVKIKKSEYIKLSRTLIKKLYDETCFGKGSLYLENLKRGIPKNYLDKVELILNSLVKQDICVYDFFPYFYIPQHSTVIKNKDIVKILKTNKKSFDDVPVKKIQMKNWRALGNYDDTGYVKNYKKIYFNFCT